MANYTFKQLVDMGVFSAAKIALTMTDTERAEILASITDSERSTISECMTRGELKEAIRRTPDHQHA